MSTTNWLILDLNLPGNSQADGQVQLSYTISNGVLQSGASLSYRVNDNSHASTIATTGTTAAGANNGTSTVYSVPNFSVSDFNLPAAGPFNGGKYDGVAFTLTVDNTTGNATLTGSFTPDTSYRVGLGDDDLGWTAVTNAPFPAAAAKKASGRS